MQQESFDLALQRVGLLLRSDFCLYSELVNVGREPMAHSSLRSAHGVSSCARSAWGNLSA